MPHDSMKYVSIPVATSLAHSDEFPMPILIGEKKTFSLRLEHDNDDVDVGWGGRESHATPTPLVHALLIFIFLLARVNLVT